ncbi:lipid asymmetry maintenance protein MlaB [Glaesserella sp.]|uniref:STAS domain-containing protein n=1 Tax=Glaesserella sp. TaxID=2094731 RepID=UPI0035A1833A
MHSQKPLQWNIQQNNESLIVQIYGKLTRDTLFPLWKQRASFLSPKANQRIYWDLKSLDAIDSAGFTLLAEMLNHYQQKNRNHVISPPETVTSLAEVFDLSEWFKQFL